MIKTMQPKFIVSKIHLKKNTYITDTVMYLITCFSHCLLQECSYSEKQNIKLDSRTKELITKPVLLFYRMTLMYLHIHKMTEFIIATTYVKSSI